MPVITPTGGGSSGGGILSATVTLTDAQVKALPTTAVQVLAAQGAGILTLAADALAFPAVVELGATNVAYTNVDPTATWQFVNPQPGGGWSISYLAHDALTYGPSGGGTPVTTICAEGTHSGTGAAINEGGENQPLMFQILNGALGNLTGGNAANTCRITVYYMLLTA